VVATVAVLAALLGAACGGGASTTSAPQDPGNAPAGNPAKAAYTPGAKVIADSDFRPKEHGFPFENYGKVLRDGSTPANLTAADMRTMFGDRVCADAKAGKCDLVPEAQTWLDSANREMAAGHCYGFSVAAQQLWQGKLNAATFGAPDISRLDLARNQPLQRLIAYDWATQLLDSVRSEAVTGSPSQVLDRLRAELTPHPSELYTVLIFKRDGRGGHAVTPYAIEDKGGGMSNLLVYDNNWPTVTRAITFNTKNDTWKYDAAVNPKAKTELYDGDTKSSTIALLPITPGLGTQECPFCGKRWRAQNSTGAVTSAGNPAPAMEEVYLDGSDTDHADLLITDDEGRRFGYVNGQLVQEIPGAHVEQMVADQDWAENTEPHFFVPAGQTYRVLVDGSALKRPDKETVGLIGPSYDVAVQDVTMRPGDKDTLVVTADDATVTYTTSRPKPWTLAAGVSDEAADYSVDVRAVSDGRHKTITLALPVDAGTLLLSRPGATGPSTVRLTVTRETEDGVQSFNRNVRLQGAQQATQSLTP